MTETTVGRETVLLVEIRQPRCQHTFGVPPCTAVGTSDQKCYEVRNTCKDAPNFALGPPLSLFFSRGHVAERNVPGVPYSLPFLESLSTLPTRINIAASSRTSSGLGQRGVLRVVLRDARHTDRLVDPYVDERSWDTYAEDRGTFWTRWLPRNKYRTNIEIVVYEGYAGQPLSEMRTRRYFLSEVSQVRNGQIVIEAQDPLARLEERKTQIPPVSPGLLYADIDAAVTSFEVSRAVEGDYATSGTLRINDEIMTYTSRADSSNGVMFSGVTRGTDNSTANSHNTDDAVQECRRFSNVSIDEALESIGLESGIDAAWMDTANWATEISSYRSLYRLNTLITEPEPATDLVSQIHEQCLVYIWWDERDSLIKLKAIRGIDEEPPVLTDDQHIIAGSLQFEEKPDQRVSQVWIYYNQTDFTKKWNDQAAYQPQFVRADLDSEAPEKHGEPSIKKIYARWLSTEALAQSTASKIGVRYVDVPTEARLRVDAKDRQFWTTDDFVLDHYLDRDENGARRKRNWTIVSAEEREAGKIIELILEDTTLNGRVHYVMAAGAPDYPGADAAPFRNCYIGDANGLLSDGSPCARIS